MHSGERGVIPSFSDTSGNFKPPFHHCRVLFRHMMAFCPNLLAQVCQKNRPKSVKLKGLFCCDNSFGVQPVISIGPVYPVGGYVPSAVYHEIGEIGAIALFKHEIDTNLFIQEFETAHRQSPLTSLTPGPAA